ncbi:MAG: pyridoxamine 5'-phosphate oxidase family protein [Acidimicrobiales bacterium]
MFEPEMITLLQSGCAAIVGTVGPDGYPHAGRAWGLDVVDAGRGTLRMLIDADDELTVDHLSGDGAVAITAANVPTLRSVQVKGRSLGVEPATAADDARAQRFCDEFFTDIVETDGTERILVERLVPLRYLVCHVQVEEIFDQTPGPSAGAPLAAEPR